MGAIYWFVFTKIFERKIGGEPYIIFLLAAMLPWMWFSSGLTEGAKALRSQRRLVASTPLPRQIWVLRSVGAKGMEFLDRKSTRLNSSHVAISYAVFCLKKKDI